jgi:hypothetical protein
MKTREEGNLILKVIEYALRKEIFTLEELEADLKEYVDFMPYIKNTLIGYKAAETNPNHIIIMAEAIYQDKYIVRGVTPDHNKSKYRLLPSAYFSYIDHIEVVEARINAKEAKRLSWIAIIISIGVGIIQILLEVIDKLV